MPTWTTIYVQLFWPALAVVTGLCLWRGDRPVRVAAIMFAIAMIADRSTLGQAMFAQFETVPAIIDFLLASALTTLAVRYPRSWLMLLAATQYLACMAHLARAFEFFASRLPYAIMAGSAGYPALAALTWGAISSRGMDELRDAPKRARSDRG